MKRASDIVISIFLIATVAAAFVSAFLVLSNRLPPYSTAHVGESAFGPGEFVFRKVGFDALPGWRRDDQPAALDAFLRSCAALTGETEPSASANTLMLSAGADAWSAPCAAAADFASITFSDAASRQSAARSFFEFQFTPFQVVLSRKPIPGGPAVGLHPLTEEKGLFTGYFEPVYPASRWKTAVYSAPLRRRPADLVSVDLGLFRDDLAGERVAGRVEGGRLLPYAERAEIEAVPPKETDEPIAWLRPNDLFFLQIQGSGVLRLPGGEMLHVGYDGQNGRPYTAIGRVLVERGDMTLDDVSMQSIRTWLESASPEDAQAVREENASYVFFRPLTDLPEPDLGPFGAEKVQLTPGRSLAVDLRYHLLGAPMWVALDSDDDSAPGLERLFIAQDTGGAVKGALRGDIFWGSGDKAGEIAGSMRAEGRLYVLVPNAAVAKLTREAAL